LLLIILIVICFNLEILAQEKVYFPSWMWGEAGTGDWFREGVKEFELKNPQFTVEETLISAADYEDKIMIELAAGVSPDLVPMFTNMVPKFIESDLLEPLDKWLDKSDFKNRLLPTQRFATKDGKTYGIVLTASPQGLIYNKKLLDMAGVGVPTNPDELFEAARKIKEKTGEFGFGFSTKTASVLEVYISLMQWVIGYGSDFADGAVPTADDPKNVEAIKFMMKFLDDDLSPKGMDGPMLRRMFEDGKLAMIIDGPWAITGIKASKPDLYEFIGYAPSPTPTHAAITGGAFYTIPKGAKNKEAAWKLIEIYNSEEKQRQWLENLVQMPGQSVMPSEEFMQLNPWVGEMVKVAAKYPAGFGYAPPGFVAHAGEFQKIVVDNVGYIFAGVKSVEEALKDCQIELQNWVKNL
jgi:multiple sugar transport system substrate-binding protein